MSSKSAFSGSLRGRIGDTKREFYLSGSSIDLRSTSSSWDGGHGSMRAMSNQDRSSSEAARYLSQFRGSSSESRLHQTIRRSGTQTSLSSSVSVSTVSTPGTSSSLHDDYFLSGCTATTPGSIFVPCPDRPLPPKSNPLCSSYTSSKRDESIILPFSLSPAAPAPATVPTHSPSQGQQVPHCQISITPASATAVTDADFKAQSLTSHATAKKPVVGGLKQLFETEKDTKCNC